MESLLAACCSLPNQNLDLPRPNVSSIPCKSPVKSHSNVFLKRHSLLRPLILTSQFTFICPPSLAAESVLTDQKINLEAIVVGIDDFFNKYPFFVTVVGVIWLVVIPLAQDYLSKYKDISAVDAFVKLREDPNTGLLDIRDDKSLAYLGSPDLTLINKTSVQVHFNEDADEQIFLKGVLAKFNNPADTIVCVLDNFDGNSLRVAELLVKMGFKEAYAIKGGVRGKGGWQEIQDNLLPPSVHVYPNTRIKSLEKKQVQVKGDMQTIATDP